MKVVVIPIRQTPVEGRRTYRPKRCRNKNKDEDTSPKTLNDKKYELWLVQLEQSTKDW